MNVKKIPFIVVEPRKISYRADAHMVIIPAESGDMGIMAGHVSIVATLRAGTIVVRRQGKGDDRIFIEGGFLHLTPDSVKVFVEHTVNFADVTVADMEKLAQEAEERASNASTEQESVMAKKSVALAKLRLEQRCSVIYG